MKKEKDVAPMDFAEYLENQAFQRTAKFIEMKGIVQYKVHEVQYLEKSVSHWLLAET